mgnify:CR=1 FL=1
MDKIFIGIIIAIAIGVISFVFESDFYPKYQKWIIGICILFPPAMLVFLIIFSVYNKISPNIIQTTQESITNFKKSAKVNKTGKVLDQLQKLNDLKKEGVISKEEYERLSKELKKDF